MTRAGLEDRRDVWGSKYLAEAQKRERDALDKVQMSSGSRSRIDFASGSASGSNAFKGKSREKESGGGKDYSLILPMDATGELGRSDSRRKERRVGEGGKRKERDEEGRYDRDRERERERKRDRWKGA